MEPMTAERFVEIREILEAKRQECAEREKTHRNDAIVRRIDELDIIDNGFADFIGIPNEELREYKELKIQNKETWEKLIAKAESGEAKINSMKKIRPGSFVNRAYRTFTLSESTGIKFEKLIFFRATLTAKEKDKFAREWEEAKKKKI